MTTSIDKSRKKFGALTIFLSISYLILVFYCIVALFIAYAIQKEECPMGFLILPALAWPALIIFLVKFHVGLKFLKNKFGFRRFKKYLISLFVIETVFWLARYYSQVTINKWFLIILAVNYIFYLYCLIFIFFRRKELLRSEETSTFYLGICVIQAVDIFLGTIYAFFMVPQLFDFRSYWIKNFPLDANIFNVTKQMGMICLVYLYFWSAVNIKKFTYSARKVQLAVSSLAVIEIFTGSSFSSFLPVHIFAILYLNTRSIKNLFGVIHRRDKSILPEKALLPILSTISLVVIMAWLYQYSWEYGFNNHLKSLQNKYSTSAQLSQLSDNETDGLLKAMDLYDEGKYKEALEILSGLSSKTKLAPEYKMILASCYGQLGEIEKAKSIGEGAVEVLSDDNATHHYNIACYYSIIKENDKSIQHLKRSIQLDKAYIRHAKEDNDFKNIKDTQEFRAIIGP